MVVRENISLSVLTTFRIGGAARYVVECMNVDDVREAVQFARGKGLPFVPLGEGSNLLAPDDGYSGVIIHMRMPEIEISEDGLARFGAGVIWDQAVRQASMRGLWGIENLAGIPGTIGASPVQNIGAYGAELADTLVSVEVLDAETGSVHTFDKESCAFGYRESRFKREPNLIITSVTLALQKDGTPRTSYKDLAALAAEGTPLTTPGEIADAVRKVRAQKFPDLREFGTAGSFFKNPFVTQEVYASLKERYAEMPGFESVSGVKIPLAWILDHALSLRGYSGTNTKLFERQPLVLVAESGARAADVDALAADVTKKVFDATGITIEREVRSLV